MSTVTNGVPPHFLVVIPGIMGSKLRDKTTGEIIWLDFSSVPINPLRWGAWLDHLFGTLAYPNDNLEPAGIVDQVVFAPPWAKLEQYSRLVDALKEIGYQADPAQPAPGDRCMYTFPYDWRQDNRISARQLGEAIDRWRTRHPGAQAWIIAHSNGGLVARWYIEKLGGKEHVGRLLLMASPRDGAPKALQTLFEGMVLLRQWPNILNVAGRSRAAVRTFPCAYQLLPVQHAFLRDATGKAVDLAGAPWLSEAERQLLLDGRRFNEDLGTTTSVETLCFFGRKQQTTTAGSVQPGPDGNWDSITWDATELGDGTVPEGSAVHPKAKEKLPFVASHGDIYVHPSVKEFLQWELVDQYRQAARVVLTTARLTIVFESDRDFYEPGEQIQLRATIERTPSHAAVSNAAITVQLRWRAALPGSAVARPPGPQQTTMQERAATPGQYDGSMTAPDAEGYYQLLVLVRAGGAASTTLEELVAVEARADLDGSTAAHGE
jgi:hypothetical protein